MLWYRITKNDNENLFACRYLNWFSLLSYNLTNVSAIKHIWLLFFSCQAHEIILLTELPQYTTDPYTKESLDNAHSSTRGVGLEEVKRKKVRFKEEIEYENQDDDAMTQTTTTSRMVKSTTFLGQIRNVFKKKVKEEITTKSWADIRVPFV